MSSNLVVVALPADDDRVWQFSSEKKPHLTLLFLGDAESNPKVQQIVEFVDHAVNVSEHGPFYMDIDHRGTLGPDEADVLFFRKGWSAKWITQLRGQLLQNADIKTAYDSTTQYDEWTPHLTLGYPATPANEDKMPEHGLHGVRFDRIAVWTGNFDGPEFRLEWPEDDWAMEVAWSVERERGRQFAHAMGLEHHGVKGMKWGVRRDRQGRDRFSPEGHDVNVDIAKTAIGLLIPITWPATIPSNIRLGKRFGAAANAKAADKQSGDNQWKKELGSVKKGVEVHNKAADEIDKKLSAFNNDARWKGVDLTTNAAKMKEYNSAFEREVMNPAYANAAAAVHGTSPSGRYKFEIHDAATATMKVTDVAGKVRHAAVEGDDFDVAVNFDIIRDVDGHVTGFEWPQSTAQHGEEFVEGLMHYGVKGMRWGVRKEPPAAVAPTATSRVPHGDKRKTKIKTEGGQNHPAHEDAIKVAQAKVKLAKSGPSALSNQELRDVAQRVQLEQQVKQLVQPRGRKFVKKLLGQQGQQAANEVVNKQLKRKLATAALI